MFCWRPHTVVRIREHREKLGAWLPPPVVSQSISTGSCLFVHYDNFESSGEKKAEAQKIKKSEIDRWQAWS